ncbi:MAG: hypothetical protein U0Z53_19005 [Blastocatellia bacterium]
MRGVVSAFCRVIITLFAIFIVVTYPVVAQSNPQKSRINTFRRVEPNVYSPELYSEMLRLTACLVNLPGAKADGSYYELTYKVYFLPEMEYWSLIKERASQGLQAALPEEHKERILIAEGQIRNAMLKNIPDRRRVRGDIIFKKKIPEKLQTRFAALATVYSFKVYDATLEKTIYKSGYFITNPFEELDRGQMTARRDLFLNFFITQDGDLYRSQIRRDYRSEEW